MKTRRAERDRLLGEDGPADGTGEVESIILPWRMRALDYVIWAALAIGAVPLLLVLVARPAFAPAGSRSLGVALYALLAVLAVPRILVHPLRAWAFLGIGYGIAALTLSATGLEGAGRIVLLAAPFYGVVLLGTRSGWAAAVVSLVLYAGAALLDARGAVLHRTVHEGPGEPGFWLLQGAMMVLVMGPVMILLTQFFGHLRGALTAEREAAGRIEAAARERQRLEGVLLETAERERRTVGHQLHDGPCQQITAALLRCKVVENALVADENSCRELAHVRAIAEMLDESVGEIHDLARGLSPAELAPGSFAAALDEMARRVRVSEPIECEFRHHGPAHLVGQGPATQLYLIAQEAVNNAVRHADARRIDIELDQGAEVLQLLVRDDGRGMVEKIEEGGMGLRIMRHRAELIGGSLSVGPADGGGTQVTCLLPISARPGRQEHGA